jgi:ribosomal protein S12 methylthiotransferase
MAKSGSLNILPDERASGSSCSVGAPKINTHGDAYVPESGFQGNVAFVTLGCAKNMVDSEVMLGVLQKKGFHPIDELKEADLIVVNTCAFLESAVKEGIDTILEVARYKEEGRCRKLIVAGCLVERYRGQLQEELPEVDTFISTDELLKVADENHPLNETFNEARRPYFLYDDTVPRIVSTERHTAYVKIAEGCDRPCAFCIIPKIRGAFRSREKDSVVREVTGLLDQNVKEINFIAQDLTAYGTDFKGNRGIKGELPSLVQDVIDANRERDFWLRLYYAYPVGVNEELIGLIRDTPQVCNYLDLPLQHISNSVLKSMRRPLGEKGTRGLIDSIRIMAPSIHLRTTFVVGFPGETEEDVDALEAYIREGHFTHVGIFTYSNEKEAFAFDFPNQVDQKVKDARRDRLMIAQRETLHNRFKGLIGTKGRALFEGFHPESDLLYKARFEWQGPDADGITLINDIEGYEDYDLESLVGKFVNIEVTDVAEYDLVATLVK